MIEALVSVLEPLEVCAYLDNNFIVCERIRRQIAGGGLFGLEPGILS